VDYSTCDTLQQLVYRQKLKNIDHLKQVLNGCWDVISQGLLESTVLLTSGLLIVHSQGGHTVTLNIVSVNSAIDARRKLFPSSTALKMLSV